MDRQPNPRRTQGAGVSGGELLTGSQLVAVLAQLGIGQWTPDAVRQWVKDDPACPIAERSPAPGAPHRYRLADVLEWLRDRAAKNVAGHGCDPQLSTRIDRARASLREGDDHAPGIAPSLLDTLGSDEIATSVRRELAAIRGIASLLHDWQAQGIDATPARAAAEAITSRALAAERWIALAESRYDSIKPSPPSDSQRSL